jgi:hypothetical protein
MMNYEIDPYAVLGISANADADTMRAAYLAKVKEFPPDRDGEKFREIHAAYQMLGDPLVQANTILRFCREAPDLKEVVSIADRIRPCFQTQALLALGNHE